jgi:hypothetical protein
MLPWRRHARARSVDIARCAQAGRRTVNRMLSDFRFVIGALLAFAILGVGSTDAVRKGNDFPTVWNTLLKSHLVEGIPRRTTGIRWRGEEI